MSSRKGKHETSIIDEEDQVDGLVALAYRSPEPLQERRRARELDAQQRGLHRRDGPCLVGRDGGPRTSSAAGAQQMRDLANCTTTDLPGATVSFRAPDSRTRCTCACSVLNA
jgi:hypothetical protein